MGIWSKIKCWFSKKFSAIAETFCKPRVWRLPPWTRRMSEHRSQKRRNQSVQLASRFGQEKEERERYAFWSSEGFYGDLWVRNVATKDAMPGLLTVDAATRICGHHPWGRFRCRTTSSCIDKRRSGTRMSNCQGVLTEVPDRQTDPP